MTLSVHGGKGDLIITNAASQYHISFMDSVMIL